jgi:hypothetical protein
MKNLIMTLINKELENEVRYNNSDIREKLLEELLEEVNNQPFIFRNS